MNNNTANPTRTKYQHSTIVLMSDDGCGKCPEPTVKGTPLCQKHLAMERRTR